MRLRSILLWVAVAGAFAFLCGLGTWQVKRLQWKEALIAETHARIAKPARSIDELAEQWKRDGDVNYYPVELSGVFQHDREMYFYNTLDGTVGWNVFTPLVLEDGRVALVNRGFVPDANRDSGTRQEGQQQGLQNLKGLARNPLFEKPNSFVPDNDIANKSFYWKDFNDMIKLAGDLPQDRVIPFFIDAGAGPDKNGLPLGGTTRISFTNNHLQYAITWYGLAGALVLVAGFYAFSARRGNRHTGA